MDHPDYGKVAGAFLNLRNVRKFVYQNDIGLKSFDDLRVARCHREWRQKILRAILIQMEKSLRPAPVCETPCSVKENLFDPTNKVGVLIDVENLHVNLPRRTDPGIGK